NPLPPGWTPPQTCSNSTPKAYAKVAGLCPLPPILVSPTSVVLNAGQQTTFAATVDWPAVTYQWYYGTSGDTRNPIPNATTSVITEPSLVRAYWVRATDECGIAHVDSSTLTVSVKSPSDNSICSPVVI